MRIRGKEFALRNLWKPQVEINQKSTKVVRYVIELAYGIVRRSYRKLSVIIISRHNAAIESTVHFPLLLRNMRKTPSRLDLSCGAYVGT